jgi:hypothetical protein
MPAKAKNFFFFLYVFFKKNLSQKSAAGTGAAGTPPAGQKNNPHLIPDYAIVPMFIA